MDNMSGLLAGIEELYGKIARGESDSEGFQRVLAETEKHFFEASASEGYDPNHEEEITRRLKERSVQKLRRLERKIESGNSLAFLEEQAALAVNKIRDFWKEAGFNYVSNAKFDSGGFPEIEFGFSLDYGSFLTDKKATERERAESVKARLIKEGYKLDEKEKSFIDCDSNKRKIEEVLLERFPSAFIMSWETRVSAKKEQKISKLVVRIRDLADI